jgi:RNA polymerase sigma-70 factor (ECF subfamily)
MKPTGPEATLLRGDASKSVNEQQKIPSKQTLEAKKGHADQQLVQRVQAGDDTAFRELYELYNRRVYAVAFSVVKNQQDALDIVQDAFIKVHKHIDTFQGTSSFYTWLYRIAMNLAIDHVRKVRRVVDFDDRIGVRDDAVKEPLMPSMENGNPGKTVVRKELTKKINQALDSLPEYHKAVIILREVEGLSYEEMSQILQVPKGTVMSRLFHARRKMQESLEVYLDGDFEIEG